MKLFIQLFRQKQVVYVYLSFFLIPSFAFCQSDQIDFSDFGNFSQQEIDYKACPFDKDADAVIFFDKAISNYDDERQLITERSIRFKILKDKAKELGDIRIRFYSGDNLEFIRDIKAVVLSYDDQGNKIINNVDRKLMFTSKDNSLYSSIRFAVPNVKAGSIIEYRYTKVSKHYGFLKDWEFQQELPILSSSYKLYVIPNAEFTYSVYKNDFMDINIKPDNREGSVYFNMKNIPGLRNEAFTACTRDYIQRVIFQFSGYTNYFGKNKVNTTWKDLGKDLLTDEDFGIQLNKKLSNTDDLKAACDKIVDPVAKIKFIYNYVRSVMAWDNFYSIYCGDGLKTVWERKKGNTGEINLVLINLLKANGIEASPLLVSERDNGKVDTTYPFIRQFNKVVAYVALNGNQYILDGTDHITPFGVTPFDLLNTKAFIVDKKNGGFLTITDNQHTDREIISLMANVSSSGTLSGQTSIYNYDYSKIYKVGYYRNDVNKYKDAYIKQYNTINIDSFDVKNIENDSLPLNEQFKLTSAVNKSGDYYLLNYNLFTGLEKNPFVSEHRFTNIDFGCRHSTLLNGLFIIPENMDTETLPQNISIKTPDNAITLSRIIEKQERNIRVMIKMEIVNTEYPSEAYSTIQSFYKRAVELLNEPIVLKTK